ncbi:unnamed protein product [Ascophyllum nodosum]
MFSYRSPLYTLGTVALSCIHTSAFVPSTTSSGASLNTRSPAPSISSTVYSRPTQQRRTTASCAGPDLSYLDDPLLKPLADDDYVAFGMARCYVRNDNLKLDDYYVYEPLTAATLEIIANSPEVPTSYKRITAFKAVDIFEGPVARPTGIQVEKLNILCQDEEGHICENALERTLAAARTYKRRVEAKKCGFGDVMEDFNFNTERKRILNHKFEPSFDDNVKQDKSIDVYGREDDDAVSKQVEQLENL